MPLASKTDTDLQSIIKAQIALEKHGDKEGSLTIKSKLPLLHYMEARRLGQELKDLQGLECLGMDEAFLNESKIFTPQFIKWFKDIELPKAQVIIKDSTLEVKVTGSLAALALVEVPLLAIMSEHFYSVSMAKMNLSESLVLSEAIRRFQVKADVLREYPNIKIVVGGTKNRFSFEWQNMLFTLLVGEFGDRLIGTTNPIIGLSYGIDVKSYLNSDMWADEWPTKDIYPVYPSPKGWKGARLDLTTIEGLKSIIDKEDKNFTFVLTDMPSFDIAHLQSHIANTNIIYEFENFITNDISIKNPQFEVIRKVSTKINNKVPVV